MKRCNNHITESQALQLSSLTSHTSHIQPCSARSASTNDGDQRIWEGLDWVVNECGKRVYYGRGGGTPSPNEATLVPPQVAMGLDLTGPPQAKGVEG